MPKVTKSKDTKTRDTNTPVSGIKKRKPGVLKSTKAKLNLSIGRVARIARSIFLSNPRVTEVAPIMLTVILEDIISKLGGSGIEIAKLEKKKKLKKSHIKLGLALIPYLKRVASDSREICLKELIEH